MTAKPLADGVETGCIIDEEEYLYAPWVEGLTPPAKQAFLQAAKLDPCFEYIFRGSKLSPDHHLILKLQVQYVRDDAGLWLVYNGHRYGRSDRSHAFRYKPVKLIRELGRLAREQPNSMNTHAEVHAQALTPDGYRAVTLDTCPVCGGEMVYDHTMELYCRACGLLEQHSYIMPPGYDSLGQSAPMSEHKYD